MGPRLLRKFASMVTFRLKVVSGANLKYFSAKINEDAILRKTRPVSYRTKKRTGEELKSPPTHTHAHTHTKIQLLLFEIIEIFQNPIAMWLEIIFIVI